MIDNIQSGEFKYRGIKMLKGLKGCPNCGRDRFEVKLWVEEGAQRGFEGYVSRNMKTARAVAFLLFMSLFRMERLVGSQTPLSVDEMQFILGEAESFIRSYPKALSIAFNNILISLILYMPIFGLAFLLFASYRTGKIISTAAQLTGSSRSELPPSISLIPLIWFEIAVYNLAMSGETTLFLNIPMKLFREESKTLAKMVLICATLLTMSAIMVHSNSTTRW